MTHMSPNELADAVTALKGGESLVYYTGDLDASRYFSEKHDTAAHIEAATAIGNLGDHAYHLAEEEKLGFLVQRRVKFGIFDYIFIKKQDAS